MSAASFAAAIRTDDLCRQLPRRDLHEGLSRLAAAHQRRLVGDWHTGPRLVGDLVGDVVELSWGSEPAAEAVPLDPAEAAGLWLDRLWGEREGRAVLCVGVGPSFTNSGRYKHQEWRQRDRFRWPRDRQRLLEEALTAAPTADVYVGVLLHEPGTSGRTKQTALPGAVAWGDVDGQWTPQRQQALDALSVEAWQVESGARGGRHVYLPLGQELDRDRLEALNRRLCLALEADDGWDVTKVLRLPGTLNHKPAARGGAAVPVRWVQ